MWAHNQVRPHKLFGISFVTDSKSCCRNSDGLSFPKTAKWRLRSHDRCTHLGYICPQLCCCCLSALNPIAEARLTRRALVGVAVSEPELSELPVLAALVLLPLLAISAPVPVALVWPYFKNAEPVPLSADAPLVVVSLPDEALAEALPEAPALDCVTGAIKPFSFLASTSMWTDPPS